MGGGLEALDTDAEAAAEAGAPPAGASSSGAASGEAAAAGAGPAQLFAGPRTLEATGGWGLLGCGC
jgi:hypothetical protein